MFRKRWALLQLLVLSFALAAACVAASAEPVTITFMHWGTGPDYIQRNESLIAEFERLNPDIKVERIGGGSGTDYDEALLTRIAGGRSPDVFMVDLNNILAFADYALDLRPFVERDVEWGWHSLPPAARDIMSVGDKVVGTLDSISPNMWYYNNEMIEAAGLENPTDQWRRGGWTWDDFRTTSQRLHRVDGQGNVLVWGNSAGTGQALNRLFMWSNGAAEFDDVRHPTKSLYDTPEAIEAMRFIQMMQIEDRISLPHPQGPNFAGQQVAMMARWSSGIASFGLNAPFEFGVAPYPKAPNENGRYTSDVGASIFTVSRDTQHPEEAWRWAAFLGGPEAAAVFAEQGPGLPIRPGVQVGFFPDNLIYPEAVYELVDLPNDGNQVRLMSRNSGDINRIIDAEVARIMSGEVPAETGMVEIARLVNAYLRENPQ